MKKLFWYEWIVIALFLVGTLLVNAVTSTLGGGKVIPENWMLAVPLAIFVIGSAIVFMGMAAALPKGFVSVKYEMIGFGFLGSIFILFGSAAFWQILSGTVVLRSVPSPTAVLMLLSLASFSMHKTWERRKLLFL